MAGNPWERLASAVEAAAGAVVGVGARARGASTGIAWKDDLVVTADHTVEREDDVRVTLASGEERSASLAGRDEALDLAVLRVAGGGLAPPSWSDGGDLRVGHVVLSVARPGAQVRAALGIVSVLGGEWRTWGGGRVDRLLRTDLRPFRGFSGSALVDAQGLVLGMNTSRLSRDA